MTKIAITPLRNQFSPPPMDRLNTGSSANAVRRHISGFRLKPFAHVLRSIRSGLLCTVAFFMASMAKTEAGELDWPAFMSSQDMVWDTLPTDWTEGPYTGNGMLGAMIHLSEDGQALEFKINRGDVQDHRDREHGILHDIPRLPIGSFHLESEGAPNGADLRLDLWNAELRGYLETDRGRIAIRHYTHATEPVIVIEIIRGAGEEGARLTWVPAEAISPRQAFALKNANNPGLFSRMHREGYEPPPEPQVFKEGDIGYSVQPLANGYETAAAWRKETQGNRTRLIIHVAHGAPTGDPKAQAGDVIERIASQDMEILHSEHRAWWNAYYPQSFVSLPDRYWESFYWIQMYKLASTTRADGMLVDTCGIWLEPITPWPAAWWNLNVQVTYWPLYGANRLDLAKSLTRVLDENHAQLSANAGGDPSMAFLGRNTDQHLRDYRSGREFSNLLWAMHNYWLHYRYSMDETMLHERLLPLLEKAINYTLSRLTESPDGTLNTPRSISPEYAHSVNTNYDLGLIRWSLLTLIEQNMAHEPDHPKLPVWQDALARLLDFPIDEKTGYKIAEGRLLESSHRHYSHLLMFYPLYLVNWDQEENRELIKRSVDHWAGMGRSPDGAYRDTGAGSMYASMGLGDLALERLNRIRPRIEPNTMYRETGPVIETPLTAAQTIHDMLLQSWGDCIRVMPAVSDAWQDVSFRDLRTEGAFLVSAVRQGGETRWVRVKSLAGEPLRISPNLVGKVLLDAVEGVILTPEGKGQYTLNLTEGQEALLYTGDRRSLPPLAPVQGFQGSDNPFGINSN